MAAGATEARAVRADRVRVVPSRRLVLVAVVLVVVALGAAMVPWGGGAWVLAAVAVVVAAGADAVVVVERMRRWTVRSPAVVRGRLGGEVGVAVVLERPAGDPAASIRQGLEEGAGLRSAVEEATVLLPAGGGAQVLRVTVVAEARGRRKAGRLHVAVASPAGLWEARARFPLETEARVHPDVVSERKAFAAAFLPRAAGGLKLHRQLGRGREFEKLREYVPGDGFDEVDWKGTARRGRPITRVFQVERTQEVYAVVDASRHSGRRMPGPDGAVRPALERQVAAALALAGLAARQGDRLGLVVHAERVLSFVGAGASRAHFNACREVLADVEVHPVSPDPAEVLTHLAARLRRRALLVLLTDLSDSVVAEQMVKHLPIVSRRHLVLVVQPQPPSLAPVFEGPVPETDEGVLESLAWHEEWEGTRQNLAALAAAGARGVMAPGPRYVGAVVTGYLNLRQDQAL